MLSSYAMNSCVIWMNLLLFCPSLHYFIPLYLILLDAILLYYVLLYPYNLTLPYLHPCYTYVSTVLTPLLNFPPFRTYVRAFQITPRTGTGTFQQSWAWGSLALAMLWTLWELLLVKPHSFLLFICFSFIHSRVSSIHLNSESSHVHSSTIFINVRFYASWHALYNITCSIVNVTIS